MAFDKDAFLTALDSMTVMELNDLVRKDRIQPGAGRSGWQQGCRHQGRA